MTHRTFTPCVDQIERVTVYSGERRGWSIEFSEHGRAFDAYLYPGHRHASALVRVRDSLRVAEGPG